jgi:hypothetical protein
MEPNNLLAFDIIDLTEITSISCGATGTGNENGCGKNNGNCTAGCGCAKSNGYCGATQIPNPPTTK